MAQPITEITTVPTNAQVIKILNEVIKRYNSLANIYTFKGNVQTYDDLLAIENPEIGDVYNVIEEDEEHQIAAGSNFVWDGTVWDNLGGSLAGLVQSVNGINPDSLGNVLLPLIKGVSVSDGNIVFTKNDDTTINVDNVKKLYTTMLGENVDLNTLTRAGIYMCGNNDYAANYENCPIQKAFLLEVQATVSDNFVFQFLTQYNDGSTEAGNQYIRTYQVSRGWSAWRMAGSGSNLTTYTSLEQLGITPGEETFAAIHNALPLNSELMYYRDPNIGNSEIYPSISTGLFKATKLVNDITKFEFVSLAATSNDEGSIATEETEDMWNIGVLWETFYLNSVPSRSIVWNRHISSVAKDAQGMRGPLYIDTTKNANELLRLMRRDVDGTDANLGLYMDIVFRNADDYRLGGIRAALRKGSAGEGTELRSNMSLYVTKTKEEGGGSSEAFSSVWSAYQGKILSTLNGLVNFSDHIMFLNKKNGQFGYIEVASSADVKAIPQGNYFFYGTATTGDSDTTLAGIDFQGISMRQTRQAFQLVCVGNKIIWRYDDGYNAGANPSYSAWIQLKDDNNNLASAKSINTNGTNNGNYYYRLPDGLQICMGCVALSNSGDEKQVGPFSFAAAFTYAPKVVACMVNDDTERTERTERLDNYDGEVHVRSISTTNFYLYQQSFSGNPCFCRASYIAIGRWK